MLGLKALAVTDIVDEVTKVTGTCAYGDVVVIADLLDYSGGK